MGNIIVELYNYPIMVVDVPVFNEENRMTTILKRPCPKHRKDVGQPCWSLEGSVTTSDKYMVCNLRAKRAGYYAKISEASLVFRGKGKKVARRSNKTKKN